MEKDNNQKRLTNFILGIILSGIGLIFLLNNIFHYLTMSKLWPLFMLIPAFLLTWIWVRDKKRYYLLLFPITILSFYTIYFLWLNFTSWYYVESTWPNFIIGPALGFFFLYLPKKEWGFLLPSIILFILAAIFYSELLYKATIIASIIFIVLGVFFIVQSQLALRKKKSKDAISGEDIQEK